MAKCSLCGGELDSRRRCTFCGLDNTKNDRQYKTMINKSNCDGEPLTHVHTHSTTQRTVSRKKSAGQTNLIVPIICIIAVIFGFVTSMRYEAGEYDVDYAYEELPYSSYLEEGEYIVGEDIPEGTYTIALDESDGGVVEVYEITGSTKSVREHYDMEGTKLIENVYLEEENLLYIAPGTSVYIYALDPEEF